LAIGWPLWAEGGMGLGTADSTRLYLGASGQVALASAAALEVFEQLLVQDAPSLLVLSGERRRIHQFLGCSPSTSAALIGPVLRDLQQLLGTLLQIAPQRL